MEKIFNDAFFAINKVVAFDKTWANGTGYYDGACKAELPEVAVGEYFRTVDPGTNRRILGLKVAQGQNVVVFERYSQSMGCSFVLVNNLPRGLSIDGWSGALNKEAFEIFTEGKIEPLVA